MAHGDAREGKWRGNWRKEWVASTLHTTSEHGISSITTADAHTSAASSRLKWLPHRFKWTRPFRWNKKSGFSACAITFQTQSTTYSKTVFVTLLRIQHAFTCTVLHCLLWPVVLCNIFFSTLLINGANFCKVIYHKMRVSIFATTVARNISHSKTNWARYDQKCLLLFI